MTITPQANVGKHLLVAAQLLDELDGQLRREARSYTEGYYDGYRNGYEVGYAHAEQDAAKEWRAAAGAVRPHGTGTIGRTPQPALAELQQLRDQPGGAAYLARLKRHNGHEYQGGPVDWETGQPLQTEACA